MDLQQDKIRCRFCKSKQFLHKHHIDWKIQENGRPKSNKKGPWIWLCQGCHFMLHRTPLLAIEISDKRIKEYIDFVLKDKLIENKKSYLRNFLHAVGIGRYKPKDLLDKDLFLLKHIFFKCYETHLTNFKI